MFTRRKPKETKPVELHEDPVKVYTDEHEQDQNAHDHDDHDSKSTHGGEIDGKKDGKDKKDAAQKGEEQSGALFGGLFSGSSSSKSNVVPSTIMYISEDTLWKLLGGKDPRTARNPVNLVIAGPRCSLDDIDSVFEIIPPKALNSIDFSNNIVEKLVLNDKECQLRTLIGAHNKIKKLALSLPHLKELDMSQNLLQEFPDLKVPELTALNLSKNQISGMCIGLVSLPKLKRLDLSDNKFSWSVTEFATFLQTITRMKDLTEISMRGNSFYGLEFDYRMIFVRFCPKLKSIDGTPVTSEEARNAKEILGRSEASSWQQLQKLLGQEGSVASRSLSITESARTGFSFARSRKIEKLPEKPTVSPGSVSSELIHDEEVQGLEFQSLYFIIQNMKKAASIQELTIFLYEFEGALVQVPIDINLSFTSDFAQSQIRDVYGCLYNAYVKLQDILSLRCIIRFSCLLYCNFKAPEDIIDTLHMQGILYDPSFNLGVEEIVTHSMLNFELATDSKDRLMRFLFDCMWDDNVVPSMKPIAVRMWSDLSGEAPVYSCSYFSMVICDDEAMGHIGIDNLLDRLMTLYKTDILPSEYHHPYILLTLAHGCQHYFEFFLKCRQEIPLQTIISQCRELLDASTFEKIREEKEIKLVALLEMCIGLIGGVRHPDGEFTVRDGLVLSSQEFKALIGIVNSGIGSPASGIFSVRFTRLLRCLVLHAFRHAELQEFNAALSVAIISVTDHSSVTINNRASSLYFSGLLNILVWAYGNKDIIEKALPESTVVTKLSMNILEVLSKLLAVPHIYIQIRVLRHMQQITHEDNSIAQSSRMFNKNVADTLIDTLSKYESYSLSATVLMLAAKMLSFAAINAKDSIQHRPDLIKIVYTVFEWSWKNKRIFRNASLLGFSCISLLNDLHKVSTTFQDAFSTSDIESICEAILQNEENDEIPSAPSFIETTPIGYNTDFIADVFQKVKLQGRVGWRLVRQISRGYEDRIHPEAFFRDCDYVSDSFFEIRPDSEESKRSTRKEKMFDIDVHEWLVSSVLTEGQTISLKERDVFALLRKDEQTIRQIRDNEMEEQAKKKETKTCQYLRVINRVIRSGSTSSRKSVRFEVPTSKSSGEIREEKRISSGEPAEYSTYPSYLESGAVQDNKLVFKEYLVSEVMSFLLRFVWFGEKKYLREIRFKIRSNVDFIKNVITLVLNSNVFVNNIGAMLCAFLEEVMHYEYEVLKTQQVVVLLDYAAQAIEAITKRLHARLQESKQINYDHHVLLVHISSLSQAICAQLSHLSYHETSPALNTYMRCGFIDQLFPYETVKSLIHLLYLDQRFENQNHFVQSRSFQIHFNLAQVLGHYVLSHEAIQGEIMQFIHGMNTLYGFHLRSSTLNLIPVTQQTLQHNYALSRYLRLTYPSDFNSLEKVLMQSHVTMYLPDEEEFTVVVGKNKIYFLARPTDPPCPNCPPDEFCPAGPSLESKVAHISVHALGICYDARRVWIKGGSTTYIFACPTKEASEEILEQIRHAVLEMRGFELPITRDVNLPAKIVAGFFHDPQDEKMMLCSAVVKINDRGRHQRRLFVLSNKRIYNLLETTDRLRIPFTDPIQRLLALRSTYELTRLQTLTKDDHTRQDRFDLVIGFGQSNRYHLAFDSESDRDLWHTQLRLSCPAVDAKAAVPVNHVQQEPQNQNHDHNQGTDQAEKA